MAETSSDKPKTDVALSALGRRMTQGSGGVERLMEDLGRALEEGAGEAHMLGGGNPAPVPALVKRWRELMAALLANEPERFDRMVGVYDPQHGNTRFRRAVAKLFNDAYGWGLTEDHVAVTNGGQNAYFYLFNLLAGPDERGVDRRILFPLMPEYIGYFELGLHPEMMVSTPAIIEERPGGFFKYHVDFDRLPWENVSAVCVSRPTNPSGNVLTDDEMRHLHAECRKRDALFVVDNAYGLPFPAMVFKEADPFWGEGVVLTYSLSKLGLPGLRTGIVIGPPEVCRALSSLNAIAGLANGNVGQALTLPLFESGEILDLARHELRPFYRERRDRAVAAVKEAFAGLPCRIHEPEGALFLWLWFPGLPGGTDRLYREFREAGVIVVPGHYFFHGLDAEWSHSQECVRIHYAMDIDRFPEAACRMAEVVRARFAAG